MNKTLCLIGNSSSGLRDGAYIGTPVVNVGTRQNKRLRSNNVIQAGNNCKEILKGINLQIKNGKYPSSDIYGDGESGIKIAKILKSINLDLQKTINY